MDVERFTIAFVTGVTLTRWTSAWQERHASVPLGFLPTFEDDQLAALLTREADIAFVRLPVESEGLSVIPLYVEQPMVVAQKGHAIEATDAVTLADLDGELRVDENLSPADAVELVAAAGGIVLLPQSVARLAARKDVVARPVTDAAETRIALVWRADDTTPEIEEFVGIVRGRTANSSRSVQPEPVAPKKAPPKPAVKKAKPITGRTRPRKPRRR
ncbi:LysR family substrate-binding domain-containing protein [Lacisediminihabitans changchengi]|uniref:LysR family substrate-binding domain-containing protein n=1 Tax=Lacisediminihabitans changchengi TaxID=2787634 RepID=A0A934SKM9_9MICO|nr:LysR family substrate-binding domain-containing protein [Lacisediminihabitans changchengi]MBK4348442.1 LysR family substrate-binding domain-containing protein [Lacisediminihabitans changchengi]